MLIAFSAVGHHPVDRRARRARRAPDAGRARRVRVLRRGGGDRRRHGGRGLGRAAARRRRDRAAGRAARHARRASSRRRCRAARSGALGTGESNSTQCDFAYPARPERRRRSSASRLRVAPGRARRAGRAFRRRQVHGVRAAAALLRPAAGRGAHRRHRPARDGAARGAPPGRGGAAGAGDLRRQRARERALRPARTRRARRCCAACEQACALEFIERLPQGLDTPLGERGVTLSGGQKPAPVDRARAARRPADPAARRGDELARRRQPSAWCSRALEALEKGRTTLVIAHRLATVQHADRIVVLERGEIVAAGHARRADAPGRALRAASRALQFLGEATARRIGLRRLACARIVPACCCARVAGACGSLHGRLQALHRVLHPRRDPQPDRRRRRTSRASATPRSCSRRSRPASIDLYPEYTGTIAREILKSEERLDLAAINRALEAARPRRVAFRSASATATRSACGARTPSGSASASSPTWRGIPRCASGCRTSSSAGATAGRGCKAAYGLPHEPRGLDHGLAYEALAAGEIDVMDLYTTDAKIERYAIVALEDDRRFFPAYDAVLLYRADAPAALSRRHSSVLKKLENRIDAADHGAPQRARRARQGGVRRRGARVPRARERRRHGSGLLGGAVRARTSAACWPSTCGSCSPRSRSPSLVGVPLGMARREVSRGSRSRCSCSPACCRPFRRSRCSRS